MFGLDSGQQQDCQTVKPAKTGYPACQRDTSGDCERVIYSSKGLQEKRQCIELKGGRPPKEDSTAEGKRWM